MHSERSSTVQTECIYCELMTRDAINTKGCSDKIMYKGKAKDSPKQTINAINQAIAVCEPIQFLAPAVLRRTETF